jgi:hypothetical protein
VNCYPFIEAERAQRRNVKRACELMKVSRSAYYAARGCRPSPRAVQDAELAARVTVVHGESKGRYGSPRVHAQLRAQGLRHSRKRVARLMRAQGLQGRAAKRWKKTTIADPAAAARADRISSLKSAESPSDTHSFRLSGRRFEISKPCSPPESAESRAHLPAAPTVLPRESGCTGSCDNAEPHNRADSEGGDNACGTKRGYGPYTGDYQDALESQTKIRVAQIARREDLTLASENGTFVVDVIPNPIPCRQEDFPQ